MPRSLVGRLARLARGRWTLPIILTLAGVALRRISRDAAALGEGERQRAVDDDAHQTATLRELAGHVVTAHETERSRVARKLHDELGAVLTACKLEVMRVRRSLADPAQALEKLDRLDRQINLGIALKRDIIEKLHPSSLDHLGLTQTLDHLCRTAGRVMNVRLDCRFDEVPLEAGAQLAVYRVVQEALDNVAAHARAQNVDVRLARSQGVAHVTVVDDGIGFDLGSVFDHHGLRAMRVRVEALGGAVDIDSAPGHGTRIDAWLPLQADAAGGPSARR